MTKIKRRREERDFSEITTRRVEIYKFGMWIVLEEGTGRVGWTWRWFYGWDGARVDVPVYMVTPNHNLWADDDGPPCWPPTLTGGRLRRQTFTVRSALLTSAFVRQHCLPQWAPSSFAPRVVPSLDRPSFRRRPRE